MTINIDTDTITAEQFDAFEPRTKGYVVYMCGSREDQPNVPETYKPAPEDKAEYDAGASAAYIAVLDVEG